MPSLQKLSWIALGVSALIAAAGVSAWVGPSRRAASSPTSRASAGNGMRGLVRDARLAPIADAHIEQVWVGGDDTPRVLATARTDARGEYALDRVMPPGEDGVLLVRASAVGYGTQGRHVEETAARIDFMLARGSTSITVRVVDTNEHPVAGAEVVVSIEPTLGDPDALDTHTAQSAADGTVVVRDVATAPARVHWSAWSRGVGRAFGTVDKPSGTAPVRVLARLEAGARIAGELVDTDGHAVRDATVRVEEIEGPYAENANPDGDGRFSLAGTPRGVTLALSVAGDWILAGGYDTMAVTIDRGEREKHVRIVVEHAGAIAGRVVGRDGRAVAGARVSAVPASRALTANHATTAAADGSFTLRGLSLEGAWNVEARHPERAPVFVENVSARTAGLEIVMNEGGSLEGRIVDARGRGFEGIEVYAHRTERSDRVVVGLRELAAIETSEDGRFRIEHLNPGTYRVEVRSVVRMAYSPTATRTFEHTIVEARPTRMDDVTLERGGTLRITARARAGEVSGTVSVSILPDGQGGAPHRVVAQRGADGAFRLENVVPGVYGIALSDRQRGWARAGGITVTEAQTTNVSLDLAGVHEVAGIVLDADGRPVPGAVVDAYLATGGSQAEATIPGRSPDNATGNLTRTREDGGFLLTGLEPGEHRVRVTAPGFPTRVLGVDPASAAGLLEVQLPRPASLVTRLVDANGAPLAGRAVMIETSEDGGHDASAVTDGEGIARFDAIAPARYRVRAIVTGMPTTTVGLAGGAVESVELRGT